MLNFGQTIKEIIEWVFIDLHEALSNDLLNQRTFAVSVQNSNESRPFHAMPSLMCVWRLPKCIDQQATINTLNGHFDAYRLTNCWYLFSDMLNKDHAEQLWSPHNNKLLPQ